MKQTDLHTSLTLGLNRRPFRTEESVQTQEDLAFLRALTRHEKERQGASISQIVSITDSITAPVETAAWTPMMATSILKRMISQDQSSSVEEACTLAADLDYHIAPDALPSLLEYAESNTPPPFFLQVLGERGRWLAGQHPTWKRMLPPSEDSWEYGNPETRLRFLTFLRQEDPSHARELLEATASQESPQTLAKFIGTFRIGLTQADNDFVETMRAHRRKEIRTAATEVQAFIEGGGRDLRLRNALGPYLKIHKGMLGKARWEVTLPTQFQDAWKAEGIQAKSKNVYQDLGQKSIWMAQLVAGVSPKHWESISNKSAEQLVSMTLQSEWGFMLIHGFIAATVRFRDPDWAAALLNLYSVRKPYQFPAFKEKRMGTWDREVISHLFQEDQLATLLDTVSRTQRIQMLGTLNEGSFWQAYHWLPHLPEPLTEGAALTVCKMLKFQLDQFHHSLPHSVRRFTYDLPKYTHWIPPKLYPQVAQIWAWNPLEVQWYHPYLERALHQLDLRYRFYQSMNQA
ncbi:DUF5691 domain-containing protein [Pontibacter sp. G13]|uniref:DUF5691 domain-containing protein n=1 Tax=Pontibacter sp. G13 TaxID=3074898 RepID=UPI00288B7B1F|nr:DUF5691 domain-containing protein [Pontibacter sp. G13]WNJ19718.1 DUF5691 domain-containing protein [Pontibacter sp. G13]